MIKIINVDGSLSCNSCNSRESVKELNVSNNGYQWICIRLCSKCLEELNKTTSKETLDASD